MNILAITNQKGGAGKTTTAINLGYGLASMGRRVLLVDLDPQASLSLAVGVDPNAPSLSDVIGGAQPGTLPMAAIIRNLAPGLDIAPANLDLAGAEMGLQMRLGRENVLKKALAPVKNYDLAILDCGPSLGMLPVNALAAAHAVIAPTVPDELGYRGLALLLRSIESIRDELNPGLVVLGVLVCQFDARTILHRAMLERLQAETVPVIGVIKRSVAAAKAAGDGRPIAGGDLAAQYRALAERIDEWQKQLAV